MAVRVGDASLCAVDPTDELHDVYVCVRAEEVTLEKAQGVASSARNRLKGVILEITAAGPLMQVTVDVGFHLVSLVTRQAVDELALRQQDEVVAVIKAPAIRLIPRHS